MIRLSEDYDPSAPVCPAIVEEERREKMENDKLTKDEIHGNTLFALKRVQARLGPMVRQGFESGTSIEAMCMAIILCVQDAEAALTFYKHYPEDFATCAGCNELGPACMCGTNFPKFVASAKSGQKGAL